MNVKKSKYALACGVLNQLPLAQDRVISAAFDEMEVRIQALEARNQALLRALQEFVDAFRGVSEPPDGSAVRWMRLVNADSGARIVLEDIDNGGPGGV